MRKGVCALVLACALLLCGCAVSEAEDAIEAMGVITPESGETIQQVQTLLDELSESQLNSVENLPVFRENVARYQQLCNLIETCKVSIQEIGTVTPDSGDAIQAARDVYTALEAEELISYVADLYPILEEAEDRFAELTDLVENVRASVDSIGEVSLESEQQISKARMHVAKAEKEGLTAYLKKEIRQLEAYEAEFADIKAVSLCNEALEYLHSGAYKDAIGRINKLTTTYPDHPQRAVLEEQIAPILTEAVQKAMTEKSYKKAEKLVADCKQTFGLWVKDDPDFQAVCETLENQLENLRPSNGQVLRNELGWGWGQLKITANSKTDAVVRILGMSASMSGDILFYIRKGETAVVNVPDGAYKVTYSTGSTWYGLEDGFGVKVENFKVLSAGLIDWISFSTQYSGSVVTYDVYSAKIPS